MKKILRFFWKSQRRYTFALGRNGFMYCTGIDVMPGELYMTLTPLNTRGAGRCSIEIPNEEIPKLIEILKGVADE